MSEIAAIVQATHTLSRLSVINTRDLLPHQTELEDTLRIIERSLGAIQCLSAELSGSTERSVQDVTPISSPGLQPTSENGSSRISSQPSIPRADESNELACDKNVNLDSEAKDLLQALDDPRRCKKIQSYLSSSISDPINGCGNDWTQEDPRVIDIKLCSSTRVLDARFRRGLGQRSLAIEYDEWEQKTFSTSRVSELCQDLSKADDRNGHINQFLDANSHRFKDKNSTLHGIKHGIRLLVFEKTYEHIGVSAILILVYSLFRSVKYKNYFLLKELLQGSSSWHTLARDKSPWLVQCQERYNARNETWKGFQASWQPTCGGQKRQRTADVQLLNRQLPSSAYSVFPVDIPENQDERLHCHSAVRSSNNMSHLDQSRTTTRDGQQSFQVDENTTTTLNRPPRCLDSLSDSQSVNASMVQNRDHPSLPTTSVPLNSTEGEQTQTRRAAKQSTVRGLGTTPTGENLGGVDPSSIPHNQQFPNCNSPNSEAINVFNPLDYPNLLLDVQLPPESPFPDVFNPLDYPNLVSDTQLHPDSQFLDIFNPLDYPSIPPEA